MGAVVELGRQQFAGWEKERGRDWALTENGNFTKCCSATGQQQEQALLELSQREQEQRPTHNSGVARSPGKALVSMRQGGLQTPQIQDGCSSKPAPHQVDRQLSAGRAPTARFCLSAHGCGLCSLSAQLPATKTSSGGRERCSRSRHHS